VESKLNPRYISRPAGLENGVVSCHMKLAFADESTLYAACDIHVDRKEKVKAEKLWYPGDKTCDSIYAVQ
jgi:hypothetical protein